jgi:hypothetical protein
MKNKNMIHASIHPNDTTGSDNMGYETNDSDGGESSGNNDGMMPDDTMDENVMMEDIKEMSFKIYQLYFS